MPEQHEVVSAFQTALKALQHAVLAQHGQQNSAGSSANHSSSSISSSLSQLSVCLQDLLQRQSALEQSLEDRGIAERALHRVLANKDAEAMRLQSEIARLRHAQSAAEAAGTPAAPAPALDAAGRQALVDAAVAAKEKPVATVLQLESLVAACQARISSLEAELTSAAADNSSRLAEQQKAFLAKLEQLRQVHAQQLSAAAAGAEAVAKDSSQQQQARLQALEQLLAQSKQQQEQQQLVMQATIASLQQQLAELQAQGSSRPAAANDQRLQPGTTHRPGTKQQLAGTAAEPTQDGGVSVNQVTEQAASAKSSNAAASGGVGQAANDVAALQLMEGQLMRLSGIIKSHQEEINQLRQALMASCAERQQLQQQLQVQQPALASPTPAAGDAVGGASSAKGDCSSSGPLKAHMGSAQGRGPASPAVARPVSKTARRP